ncbi:apyrase-like [Trichoplusia ni]|uniref:apyrase n=1 Tax=Trichoplusia ni TaxID=7111 RepID=A0A7E5WJE5_TRINI|nr:apyrase-like [Trichoplusia ni]
MVRVVCLLALLVGVVITVTASPFELNIIHYNDFHAHFEEVSPNGGVCDPTVSPCIGGFARLYTAIHEALEVEPDSLLLNGGDTFQGTIWYNYFAWNVSQHFMNMLPHDAHVLGNHEFDHDIEGLLPYLERLKAPMLGANVNTTLEPSIAPYVKNHIIVTRHGRQIGIIGVLLKQFSAPIGQVIMEDELEAVNREAAILSDKGVDIIILLSHIGYTSDIALARVMSPAVDIIVGGHSHTLLYTGDTPNGDNALGEYPTIVEQTNGHKILIVQASCYTRYLGNIKLYFDSAGELQHHEGLPIFLGTSIVPDPRIVSLLEPWKQELEEFSKEVLAVSRVTLNSFCSAGECSLGSLACDGFLEEVMDRAKADNWNYAHVCLINTGGLRININPGNITTEGLMMAMPFENEVLVYDLKGEYLLEALEFSVGVSWTNSFSSGRMLQIGGMRNVYNASEPVGSRVQASVRCIDCAVPRYEPLDRNATYRVVSQSYIGDGGGGYTMISNNKESEATLDIDYVMLQRYLRRQKVVMKDLDGRIRIVY